MLGPFRRARAIDGMTPFQMIVLGAHPAAQDVLRDDGKLLAAIAQDRHLAAALAAVTGTPSCPVPERDAVLAELLAMHHDLLARRHTEKARDPALAAELLAAATHLFDAMQAITAMPEGMELTGGTRLRAC